jgi:propanol-preferring alcohol dehydrogenase
VLIFGLGGLGFNALQIVMAIGSRVLVVEKRQEVLDEAIKFGLPKEDVVQLGEDVVEFVAKNKITVDVVIDFVGVKETFSASQHLRMWISILPNIPADLRPVRPGGRACQVGLLGPELILMNSLAVRKKLTILCSYGGIYEDVVDCLDLIAQGKLRPQVETGDLKDFPSVLERLHEGKIKSRIALVPAEYPSLS